MEALSPSQGRRDECGLNMASDDEMTNLLGDITGEANVTIHELDLINTNKIHVKRKLKLHCRSFLSMEG